MSFFKNDAIQVAEYEYDFAVDGGATGVYVLSAKANKASMPVGAIKVGHQVLVNTQFVGATASAIIGVGGDTDRYLAITSAANLGVGLETSSTSAVFLSASNLADVRMTISGGAMTAGKLKVLVSFVNPNE